MLNTALKQYGFDTDQLKLETIGNGLIHRTWKLSTGSAQYVLQQINDNVFRVPADIMHNVGVVGNYLHQHNPEYLFIRPVKTLKGSSYVYLSDLGYFRLFPFVKGSHSKQVVRNCNEAYEAAMQFGRFSHLLSGFDSTQLRITIPCFHDLALRHQQFLIAIENADPIRLRRSNQLIRKIVQHTDIVNRYQQIVKDRSFKLRVTHHDTKISNVLFDENDKGLCVIDLDTVMPGYFISDVGDMMRTYLSLHSEEENNLALIDIREDVYRAIVEGFGEQMKDDLGEAERDSFLYAGKFMIYMQALRFLADYLQQDRYYGESYPEQNYFRAQNQMVLLERLIEKQTILSQYKP